MRLLNRRYDEIKKVIATLYKKYHIKQYPIDAFSLCKKMGIMLVPYTSLPLKERIRAYAASPDGFFAEYEENGTISWVIFYNDAMMPERIRFTILHEIGHIVLEHGGHSDVAEAEANFFAKYAIAPPPIVHLFKPEDPYDIMESFGLSFECAWYVMSYYKKWYQYHKNDKSEYELIIVNLYASVAS